MENAFYHKINDRSSSSSSLLLLLLLLLLLNIIIIVIMTITSFVPFSLKVAKSNSAKINDFFFNRNGRA